jgi:hypothetical protein
VNKKGKAASRLDSTALSTIATFLLIKWPGVCHGAGSTKLSLQVGQFLAHKDGTLSFGLFL